MAKKSNSLEKAKKDAMNFGSGYIKVLPDGTMEHIPYMDIWLERRDARRKGRK